MADVLNPLASNHLPPFTTAPGQADLLFNFTIVFLVAILLIVGNLYLRLHAMPERLAHRSKKLQFEIVAILGLIALFTHNHLFWIAGLLLAFIEFPDFSTPIASIARSLERMSGRGRGPTKAELDPLPEEAASAVEPGRSRSATGAGRA